MGEKDVWLVKIDGVYPKAGSRARWEYTTARSLHEMIGREVLEPTFQRTLEVVQLVGDECRPVCVLAREGDRVFFASHHGAPVKESGGDGEGR